MRSAVTKNGVERGFFPWNLENMTLVARRRESGVLWRSLRLLKSLERGVWVHTNSLSSFQRYRHSVESRALTCPFEQSNLSAWSLWNWHATHIHIFERDSVYLNCLLPTVTVTPSDSNHVNRSASLKRFSWIIFTINKLVDRIKIFRSNASQND